MRYLFDRASTTGKIHRLVIDLNEGRYWAEVSDDKFYIPREAESAEAVAGAARRKRPKQDEDEEAQGARSARSR